MKKHFIIFFLLVLIVANVALAQSQEEKLFYAGKYNEALSLILQKIDNGKADAADYSLAATISKQNFDYDKSIYYYENAVNLAPENINYTEGLADAYLSIGKRKDALSYYLNASQKSTNNVRIYGKIAGVYMDLNNYTEAEKRYSELYSADSSNIYFMRKLMQARYKLQRYSYVIDVERDNLFFPEDNAEMLMLVADSYYKLNNNINAVITINQILAIDSTYLPALSKIAYIYFNAYRNYENADIFYKKLNSLELYKDPFHLKNYAICEYFTGNHEYAAKVLDSLTAVLEDDHFVSFYAGLSYKKLGNTEKSFEFLLKASTMVIPGYAGDVFHHLGRSYASKREFEQAIATYKKVREFAPRNYQVLYDIAVTYEEWNLNRTQALVYYEQFVKECSNKRSVDLKYAENRIKLIKEELFFNGE